MSRIRVLIADDHAVLRAGLRMLIDAQSDMTVVGEAADGPETVSRARSLGSDVVLLDLSMPGPPATVTIERLARLAPSPRILVLTMHDSIALATRMLRLGADGYVVKTEAADALVQAVRAVADGKRHVSACTGIKTPPA